MVIIYYDGNLISCSYYGSSVSCSYYGSFVICSLSCRLCVCRYVLLTVLYYDYVINNLI